MRLSLRYRLLLPLTLLLVGETLATTWTAQSAARGSDLRLARQLWRIAQTLSEQRTFPLTERVLQQMHGLSGAEFLLVRRSGPQIGTFSTVSELTPPVIPAAQPVNADDVPPLGPPVVIEGTHYRCLRLTLREPHPNAGDDLYIFYPESLRRAAMWDTVRPLLILGGIGGLIAVGLAFATGSRLVRRIRDIDQRTRLIAAGDFRPMPLPRTEDELTELCRSVNDMAHRLTELHADQQRTERLRVLGQFSGGLAHQLRNAAAGARLAIELFLAENPSADPEPLNVALLQLARIETNMRQFLELGTPPVRRYEHCDLQAIIEQSLSLLRPQCAHAGISLISEVSSPAIVQGDPESLGHLFNNVIGNAVEAAGPGGQVDIRLQPQADHIIVEVIDTGPGPSIEIGDRVFEPFVTGKAGGIGLGLSVALQAVQAHAGTIFWERREQKTVFRIELPSLPLNIARNTK